MKICILSDNVGVWSPPARESRDPQSGAAANGRGAFPPALAASVITVGGFSYV